eukprot:457173-Amphidinium_carterae.1
MHSIQKTPVIDCNVSHEAFAKPQEWIRKDLRRVPEHTDIHKQMRDRQADKQAAATTIVPVRP